MVKPAIIQHEVARLAHFTAPHATYAPIAIRFVERYPERAWRVWFTMFQDNGKKWIIVLFTPDPTLCRYLSAIGNIQFAVIDAIRNRLTRSAKTKRGSEENANRNEHGE